MTPPDFGNIINKMKSGAKQAADQTQKLARIAKLKTNVYSLNSEKSKLLGTIGLRAYILLAEENSTDGVALKDRVRDEIAQIQRIETRIAELNQEISDLQSTAHVDVEDITDHDHTK
jgi:hypothetical protein